MAVGVPDTRWDLLDVLGGIVDVALAGYFFITVSVTEDGYCLE